jgi:hypothetical protein
MSILVSREARVICQGIAGANGIGDAAQKIVKTVQG